MPEFGTRRSRVDSRGSATGVKRKEAAGKTAPTARLRFGSDLFNYFADIYLHGFHQMIEIDLVENP